jgi:hypothetical protein
MNNLLREKQVEIAHIPASPVNPLGKSPNLRVVSHHGRNEAKFSGIFGFHPVAGQCSDLSVWQVLSIEGWPLRGGVVVNAAKRERQE